MSEQTPYRRRTSRRSFIKAAGALGLGAAGAAVFPGSNVRVDAVRRSSRRPGKARNQDIRDHTSQDFAAGQARGVAVRGHGQGASLRGRSGARFESRAIPAPFAPTHAGLHWTGRGAAPSDISVSVRGSGNGRDWSNWQQIGIEAISSNEHGAIPVHGELTDESLLNDAGIRVFGALVGLNRPTFLQYRVDFKSDEDVDIDEVALACIDASDDDEGTSSAWFATASANTADEVTLTNEAEVSITVVTGKAGAPTRASSSSGKNGLSRSKRYSSITPPRVTTTPMAPPRSGPFTLITRRHSNRATSATRCSLIASATSTKGDAGVIPTTETARF